MLLEPTYRQQHNQSAPLANDGHRGVSNALNADLIPRPATVNLPQGLSYDVSQFVPSLPPVFPELRRQLQAEKQACHISTSFGSNEKTDTRTKHAAAQGNIKKKRSNPLPNPKSVVAQRDDQTKDAHSETPPESAVSESRRYPKRKSQTVTKLTASPKQKTSGAAKVSAAPKQNVRKSTKAASRTVSTRKDRQLTTDGEETEVPNDEAVRFGERISTTQPIDCPSSRRGTKRTLDPGQSTRPVARRRISQESTASEASAPPDEDVSADKAANKADRFAEALQNFGASIKKQMNVGDIMKMSDEVDKEICKAGHEHLLDALLVDLFAERVCGDPIFPEIEALLENC